MKALLNGICPYFTMFPLEFPLGILEGRAAPGEVVLDPFAGRGTTLYAGRLLGLHSYGIDSNPVAAAISEAKLVNATPVRVVAAAERILRDAQGQESIPQGDFWELAFEPSVLQALCRLRQALLKDCRSAARKALRALLLGALHGPRAKTTPSCFSNQCTRTYAPKPRYATKFWRERGLRPPKVDVLQLIERKAARYYGDEHAIGMGAVTLADSTRRDSFDAVARPADWIITSPPYYGMRTYGSDQWLRMWFVGGPPEVDYSTAGQLSHHSQDDFAEGLRRVWDNCALAAKTGCNLVVRFGGINDRRVDPLELLKASLQDTPWHIVKAEAAGTASDGRRQARQFDKTRSAPINEIDVWAVLDR